MPGRGRTTRGRIRLWTLLIFVLAVLAPAAASAQAPATLTGETLGTLVEEPWVERETCLPVGGLQNPVCLDQAGTFEFEIDCSTVQESGRATFTATGVATGPYPGTFTETGTIVFEPGVANPLPHDPGPPFGQPMSEMTARFEIDSPAGQITGTKQLAIEPVSAGSCYRLGDTIEVIDTIAVIHATYEARIETSDGTFRDEGNTKMLVAGTNVIDDHTRGLFAETFVSSLTEPERLLPTSAEQCKGEGYKEFPGFKNRGDCVAFVETGGKNEPGQNLPGVP